MQNKIGKWNITSRLELLLAKIAGHDVDLSTMTPPVASNLTEELLLEIADKSGGGQLPVPTAEDVGQNVVVRRGAPKPDMDNVLIPEQTVVCSEPSEGAPVETTQGLSEAMAIVILGGNSIPAVAVVDGVQYTCNIDHYQILVDDSQEIQQGFGKEDDVWYAHFTTGKHTVALYRAMYDYGYDLEDNNILFIEFLPNTNHSVSNHVNFYTVNGYVSPEHVFDVAQKGKNFVCSWEGETFMADCVEPDTVPKLEAYFANHNIHNPKVFRIGEAQHIELIADTMSNIPTRGGTSDKDISNASSMKDVFAEFFIVRSGSEEEGYEYMAYAVYRFVVGLFGDQSSDSGEEIEK